MPDKIVSLDVFHQRTRCIGPAYGFDCADSKVIASTILAKEPSIRLFSGYKRVFSRSVPTYTKGVLQIEITLVIDAGMHCFPAIIRLFTNGLDDG
jgi:hypothetical protein